MKKKIQIPRWAWIAGGLFLLTGTGMAIAKSVESLQPDDGTTGGNDAKAGSPKEPLTKPSNTGTQPKPPDYTHLKGRQVFVMKRGSLTAFQGINVYNDAPVDGEKFIAYRGEPLGKFTGTLQRWVNAKGENIWFAECDGKADGWSWKKPIWAEVRHLESDNRFSPFAHFYYLYYTENVGKLGLTDEDAIIAYAKNICADDMGFLFRIWNARAGGKFNSSYELFSKATTAPLTEAEWLQFQKNLKKC